METEGGDGEKGETGGGVSTRQDEMFWRLLGAVYIFSVPNMIISTR